MLRVPGSLKLPMVDSFTVMSFNVRGSQHRDGENEWSRRARLNVECIRRRAPDLIGFQELQKGNLRIYDSELPGYEATIGPAYENRGPFAYNAIYWDPIKLKLLEEGGFWLSETPGRRSRTWGSSHVRSANWGRFRDSSGAELVHLNTHLDHRSGEARREGSRLILRRMDEIVGDLPVLLTGDFNCNPGSKTYKLYEAAGFSDAHCLAGNPPENTFHRFLGRNFIAKPPESEARLDWILLRNGSGTRWETQFCYNVRDEEAPMYPSDHYPVVADLALV